MGCGSSKGDKATKAIEKELEKDKIKASKEFKLLILGAGESGKSTVAKQMVIIHHNDHPFSERQIQEFVVAVHQNILEAMGALLDYARRKADEYPALSEGGALASEANAVIEARDANTDKLSSELVGACAKLIENGDVQKALELTHEYQFAQSALYFFKNLARVTAADFAPTTEDILMVRRRTTGVNEIQFENNGIVFRMIDVGGQRSERRKWFQCFEDVTAIIFVVAISEYNQVLFEDEKTNRMHESLAVFQEISGSKWFARTAIILFLNKKDLFEEKIKEHDLKVCFPNYKGGNNYDKALAYIQRRFEKAGSAKDPTKAIYTHVTVATDTQVIRVVFGAVRDTIVRHAMSVV